MISQLTLAVCHGPLGVKLGGSQSQGVLSSAIISALVAWFDVSHVACHQLWELWTQICCWVVLGVDGSCRVKPMVFQMWRSVRALMRQMMCPPCCIQSLGIPLAHASSSTCRWRTPFSVIMRVLMAEDQKLSFESGPYNTTRVGHLLHPCWMIGSQLPSFNPGRLRDPNWIEHVMSPLHLIAQVHCIWFNQGQGERIHSLEE